MDKKSLGEKIKQAREAYSKNTGIKLTQQLLSNKIGISRSYLGDIESGRTFPSFLVLKAISDACNQPLSFFVDDNEIIRLQEHYDDGNSEDIVLKAASADVSDYDMKQTSSTVIDKSSTIIPILGLVRAGEPILAQQNIIGYEHISQDMTRRGEYFGLKITGDSMNNSRIFDGDIVIIRRQEEVENGEIAAVLVNGEEATIKKFFKTDSMITLVPDSSNKEHQPRFIDISNNEVRVLGKVVKVIISL